jgi:predicted transcriptional regulator of viral defense system
LEFLNKHHVFNIQEFKRELPVSATNTNLLSRAAASGKVERIRRGLYVSRSARFADTEPSSVVIASKSVDDAVFCLMTALQLHGALHNLVNLTQFYTSHRLPAFSYQSHRFTPIVADGNADIQLLFLAEYGSVPVTTREQTLVDCLDRVGLSGGPENLLRSLSLFSYMDAAKAVALAQKAGKGVCSRLGWVLQAKRIEWSVGDSILEELRLSIGKGPHYFYAPNHARAGAWDNDWKLYLPATREESAAWLNQ